MPLVHDPNALPPQVLDELHRSLLADLQETGELIRSPRGAVLDPASLVTAEELLSAALAQLSRPGTRTPSEKAQDVNLAYATMLAVIDLVKSHTEGPRVPRRRSAPT